VLRLLVADIANIANINVQGLFLIDLHALEVFSTRKIYFFGARARVGLPACFVALLLVD